MYAVANRYIIVIYYNISPVIFNYRHKTFRIALLYFKDNKVNKASELSQSEIIRRLFNAKVNFYLRVFLIIIVKTNIFDAILFY